MYLSAVSIYLYTNQFLHEQRSKLHVTYVKKKQINRTMKKMEKCQNNCFLLVELFLKQCDIFQRSQLLNRSERITCGNLSKTN